MSSPAVPFRPCPPLLPGSADGRCRAIVTVPARNEEASLSVCLDALQGQVDLQGKALPPASFETLLLLNNCTDCSAEIALRWQREHPAFALHIAERELAPEEAHVGTARRLLMDTAWLRLQQVWSHPVAILATDADTVVASDWIAQNLMALEKGADVVGGLVSLLPNDLMLLPRSVRLRYERDRRYASLVAQLEDTLDARPGDRCPRHLDHFGASLACTPEAYAAAGGMPVVSPLEDEAFVDQIRRAGCTLRHDPAVHVYTSARLRGRTSVGMAGQLRLWHDLPDDEAHTVPSAAFLQHRFRMLSQLRRIFETKDVGDLSLPTEWWRETFAEALRSETTCPGFLGAVYCDILIAEAFQGVPKQSIQCAIGELEACLESVRSSTKLISRRGAVPNGYEGEPISGSPEFSGSLQ